MNIKFSIVMPVYNAEEHMKRSIMSVLGQSYDNWELLCTDDGSEDKSLEVLNEFNILYPNKIRIFTQENSGPALARRTSIQKSSGDFIVLLDADDYIGPDYLENVFKSYMKDVDVYVPELKSQNKSGGFTSFNETNNLKDGNMYSGLDAFEKTFPWTIHGFAVYRASLMQRFYTYENCSYNNYNADEYITRLIFLNSNLIRICNGEYFHCFNPDSITKKTSLKKLGMLDTEYRLIKLAPLDYQSLVLSDSLRKNFFSMFNFLLEKKAYSRDELEMIENAHFTQYKYIQSFNKSLEFCNLSFVKRTALRLYMLNFRFVFFIAFMRKLL